MYNMPKGNADKSSGGEGVPMIKKGYTMRKLAGVYCVLPDQVSSLDQQNVITLNESGAFLWRELEKGADVDALTVALLREYEVDEQTARDCVVDFIRQLLEAGCLASPTDG